MSGRANYRNVGPVNRVRALACARALEDAATVPDGEAAAAAAAVHALVPDMPGLRFSLAGDVLDLAEAGRRIRETADADLMLATAKALRRALGHLPADLPAPRVVATVGQLREALEGLPAGLPLDVAAGGVRARVDRVERFGKGTPHAGITLACDRED